MTLSGVVSIVIERAAEMRELTHVAGLICFAVMLCAPAERETVDMICVLLATHDSLPIDVVPS